MEALLLAQREGLDRADSGDWLWGWQAPSLDPCRHFHGIGVSWEYSRMVMIQMPRSQKPVAR